MRSLYTILLLLCLGAPLTSWAVEISDVPLPDLDRGQWITDMAGVLSPEDAAAINGLLNGLDRDHGVEVAVVILPSISDEIPTPKDFATALFNEWGIGAAGEDTGLLVLLVMDDRRLEMETGYGMEALLTDGWLKRMQEREMIPFFRAEAFGAGILYGLRHVDERIRQYPDGFGSNVSPANLPQAPTRPPIFRWFFGLIFLGFFSRFSWKRYREGRCPSCAARMTRLARQDTQELLSEGQLTELRLRSRRFRGYHCKSCDDPHVVSPARWWTNYVECRSCGFSTMTVEEKYVREPTYSSAGLRDDHEKCEHCSHVDIRRVTLPPHKHSSSGRGSGGSGGSGGGGFGGGRSGGGGAGSSW